MLSCIGIALSTAGCCSQSEAAKPNILLINIDDLGWTDLGFQGSKYYQTPNIDRLRQQSIFFENGYASAANSAPSRAAMMTGVYASQNGVYTVDPPDRGKAKDRKLISAKNRETPRDCYTLLPQTLSANGYATCTVGKWHLGAKATDQGWDVNIGGNLKGHPKRYFSPYLNPDLPDGKDGEYLTDRLADEAIKFLDQTRDKNKPFFLYFATYAVHTPLQPKPDLLEKYSALQGSEAHCNPKYAAMVETMDYNVGRLLNYLDESGLTENTIVIFTTDNGGLYSVSKQWPLRAGKGSFYEGGIRVPFMVRWNGVAPQGAQSEALVSQIDLYPTILSILDIPTADLKLEGDDISDLIKGEAQQPNRALYWHFPAYLEGGNSETTDPKYRSRPVSVIRRGDWKLIYNYESGVKELYNLREDIGEKHNVSLQNPEITQSIYADLQKWLEEHDAPTNFELNPKFVEK